MRYSLRTLLLAALLAPPVLAVVCRGSGDNEFLLPTAAFAALVGMLIVSYFQPRKPIGRSVTLGATMLFCAIMGPCGTLTVITHGPEESTQQLVRGVMGGALFGALVWRLAVHHLIGPETRRRPLPSKVGTISMP